VTSAQWRLLDERQLYSEHLQLINISDNLATLSEFSHLHQP
jgi:hypothetical protein